MAAVLERRETKGLTVERGHEVVVRRKNDVGILFQISTLLSEKGVNILAVSGAVCGDECLVRLVTDDNLKSRNILAEHKFIPQEENVVLVELPHRAGVLREVTKTLSQSGIDIRHVYAAATPKQDKGLLIFHCSNDEEAMAKLKEIQADSFQEADISEGRQAERDANTNMISEGGPIN